MKEITMTETILIVDKNTTELRKLREILTREGYSVMTATSTETAQQICKQIPIKFVLGESELLDCGKESQK